MISESARYYDRIYSFKDYRTEAQQIIRIVEERLRAGRRRLLDVACGSGRHIEYLREAFEAEGLDVSQEMLAIACKRNPGVTFHHADMTDFELGHTFDVITCLFSSIGYLKTLDKVVKAVSCMARHLTPDGLLIVEPWLTPDTWNPGTVHALFIDEPELKIARVNTSFVDGHISYFDLHHLVGTPKGTKHFVEHHELGLFETDELESVFTEAGLDVTYDPEGLTGRGLFIGQKPE